jgi:DNA-binding protein H-NS
MSNAVEGKTVGKKSAAAVKYRDRKTGATCTGHRRAPSRIASAKNCDMFLVDGGTAMAAKSASAGKVEAENYLPGPQPAMYMDPKSGATWSVPGRAPARPASVKGRSKIFDSLNGRWLHRRRQGGSTCSNRRTANPRTVRGFMPIMRTTPSRDTQATGSPAGAGRSVEEEAGSDDKTRRRAPAYAPAQWP